MKRGRDDKEIINIDIFPPEILLQIFTSAKYKYPWENLHFIFNNIKMVCYKWCDIVESSEKIIHGALGIPYLHFISAMNREDEIVRLYLDKDCVLRTPDTNGYSPACYAVGNRAIRAMHRLEACYALYVDLLPTAELQIFAENNLQSTINKNYTILDFTNAMESQSIKLLEEILIWDSNNRNRIILSTPFKYHMELIKRKMIPDSPINRLAICIYKNFLADVLWNMNDTPEEIIQECLNHNINFNAGDENGITLLHMAVGDSEQLPIVKLLLSYKNIDINICDRKLYTPLSIAILNKNTEAIKLLSENSNIYYNENCVDIIFSRDNDDYLKLAIDSGYKPTMQDIMQVLIINVFVRTQTKCLKILLDIFGINILLPNGHTPISFAVNYDNDYIMNFLIRYGANLNMQIKGGSLIKMAIAKNSEKCLPILLNYLRNSIDDIPPICYAALLGHNNCIKILIKSGAQINSKDAFGETALHHAVSENRTDCIISLLDSGADVNARVDNANENIDGYTPLHYASHYGDAKTAKLLLDYGADKTLTTSFGLTAKDIAIEFSYFGEFYTIELLLQNRSDGILANVLGFDLDKEEEYMNVFNIL